MWNNEIGYNGLKVKHVAYVLLALFILISARCSFRRITIDQGEKGVIVSRPYFFGTGGVQKGALDTGGYWVWRSNEIYGVNVLPQQAQEKFDDMMSADNIPVDFDAFINFKIIDPVVFIDKWGNSWYANNIQQIFRTAVRDECKRHKMTDLVTSPEVSNKIEEVALAEVQKFAKEKNVPVMFTKVNVGKINPNADVMQEIARTAIQQQRQRTEAERKVAEDKRRATEFSRAAADNAYREAMKLAPEQYIRLEAVKAYSHAAEECAKNDKCTMILTQPGAGVNPALNMK